MDNDPQIVIQHGGYRRLIVYRKSDVIYQGTVMFCKRFLAARGDRTVDQMVQAARSCKQNIAEGSSTSGTSRETELRLTNVARASLVELLEDYRDFIKSHGLCEWTLDDPRKVKLRKFATTHNDWSDWIEYFNEYDAELLANAQIAIITQNQFLLDHLIRRQESDIKIAGDMRERIKTARKASRGAKWDDGVFAYLAKTSTIQELEQRASEVHLQINDIVRRLKLRCPARSAQRRSRP